MHLRLLNDVIIVYCLSCALGFLFDGAWCYQIVSAQDIPGIPRCQLVMPVPCSRELNLSLEEATQLASRGWLTAGHFCNYEQKRRPVLKNDRFEP